MTYDELVAKKEELEFKIDKLNESLRFGSSGNVSGVEALAKMRKNLELVNAALADATPPTKMEEVPIQPAPQVEVAPEPTPEPTPATAPPAPPAEGVVVEPTQAAQPEQLGTN